jgi:hypothetical protein
MDTNLNLQYRGKTIDTVSKAKIKVARVSSDNSLTMAAPPLTVNANSCVSHNWLFVHSNLQAKNENAEMFNAASVIDVYNLNNGVYKCSFYIPDYGNKKIRDFWVSGNNLFALNDHYLTTYSLNLKYLKE